MHLKRYSRRIILTGLLAVMLAGSGTLSRAEEKAATWDQAEQEVKEAAGEVKEAAGEVKDVTRETPKDTSNEAFEDTKARIHEATAPEPIPAVPETE